MAVTGRSAGLMHTTYVTVALPGFTITAPSNVFVSQGATGGATLTINDVNGFDSIVKLSVSGLPAGRFGNVQCSAHGDLNHGDLCREPPQQPDLLP